MNRWLAPLIALILLAVIVTLVAAWRKQDQRDGTERANLAAAPADATIGPASEPAFAVTIHRPTGPPRIATDLVDQAGEPVTVACGTCHATRAPDLTIDDAEALDEFHQGLTYQHGTLTCYSCHDPADTDQLRLADGRGRPYVEVMTVCAQCHGPQARAFAHGAHGGMTGYWDLSRGPRVRNNCVDCHDPHVPAFPRMMPTFKPRDRFLSPTSEEHRHE
ncbi:MAG: cytochrome c3 family protein [Planctomycetota bacterium]